MTIVLGLYIASSIGLAAYGFSSIIISILRLIHSQKEYELPPIPTEWPQVVVQVPVYNEQHVIKRVVDTVAALEYPPDKLVIQILDDSTDSTTVIARSQVDYHRSRGVDIHLVRRDDRVGFKAGALEYGLSLTDAEFVAVFDADSVPHPDFLQRVIPYMAANPKLGILQTRWTFLNENYNPLAKVQAMALDAHFMVEQVSRNRSKLLMHFNGTAGVLRRECIEDSGGWQFDTLSEDMDLSLRAQLKGWDCLYLPDVDVPIELPPTVSAFKVQQKRWATGTTQCLLKFITTIWLARLPIWKKLLATTHLGGYLLHPLMLILLLTSIPLILTNSLTSLPTIPLTIAALGPPILVTLGQYLVREEDKAKLHYLPLLIIVGFGITINNTLGVLRGMLTTEAPFQRTPKYGLMDNDGQWVSGMYSHVSDLSTYLELLMAVGSFAGMLIAWSSESGFALFLGVYAIGFGYLSMLSLWQTLEQQLQQEMNFKSLLRRIGPKWMSR